MVKKTLKLTLSITEWLIFVSLIVVIFVIVSPTLKIEGMPRSFIVTSGSMEPTVKTGSLVFTKPVDTKSLKEGDVITFKSPKDPKDTIFHRISKIKNKNPLTFETKGDNNNIADNWTVPSDSIYGKHFFTIPYLGHAGAFIRKPWGFALVIGLPALIFIISQIFSIKKAIKEEVDKKIAQKLKEKDAGEPNVSGIVAKVIILLCFTAVSFLETTTIARATFNDHSDTTGMAIAISDFAPPAIPKLLSPLNNAILNSEIVNFDFTDVIDFEDQNDVTYFLQISKVPDFATVLSEYPNLPDSKLDGVNLPTDTYYVRVKACDVFNNCSAYSDINTFSVQTVVLLLEPLNAVLGSVTSLEDNDAINSNTEPLVVTTEPIISSSGPQEVSSTAPIEVATTSIELGTTILDVSITQNQQSLKLDYGFSVDNKFESKIIDQENKLGECKITFNKSNSDSNLLLNFENIDLLNSGKLKISKLTDNNLEEFKSIDFDKNDVDLKFANDVYSYKLSDLELGKFKVSLQVFNIQNSLIAELNDNECEFSVIDETSSVPLVNPTQAPTPSVSETPPIGINFDITIGTGTSESILYPANTEPPVETEVGTTTPDNTTDNNVSENSNNQPESHAENDDEYNNDPVQDSSAEVDKNTDTSTNTDNKTEENDSTNENLNETVTVETTNNSN